MIPRAIRRSRSLFGFLLFLLCLLPLIAPASPVDAAPVDAASAQRPGQTSDVHFSWIEVEPGYQLGRYPIGGEQQMIRSEVLLLKFSNNFRIEAVSASQYNGPQSDIETLTKQSGAIAGINANFFDERGRTLGLLISNHKQLQKMHQGGRLLTGVFHISGGKPGIVHRSEFRAENTRIAVQAGPRLIAAGKPLKLSAPATSSRRSGIAVTKNGDVIMYATVVRFPGATLDQIQKMLCDPRLEVVDALNLDGGGSSQLYIKRNSALPEDTFITGRDKVPAALVVKRMKDG